MGVQIYAHQQQRKGRSTDSSKTFNVRVDPTTHNRMKVLAAKMDISMSELIRKAVLDILERHEPAV
ncbi:CopG family ribbon-helix-helix protein [Paraburkholderia strydomiana]|uniref:CopG family ribbon-helix-helix protein n=1 Tax=Paraburkholderia strydomiana TaxID=1245417 RepID=UPI0038BC00BF